MKLLLTLALLLPGATGWVSCAQSPSPAESAGKPVVLDHVVAVINGDVLLESDVDEEMHLAVLEPFEANAGADTPQSALSRLINRALIVQQMKEQQQFNIQVSDADVEKSLRDLRSHLPECAKYDCVSDKGWNAFLAANDLTNDEVVARWHQRLTILQFIDLRFRNGISISQASIADYYAKSVIPAFIRQHETAPALKDVSARIREVLLEQQVNGLLQDWLTSLRDEGSVRILDPAYASATDDAAEAKADGEE